MTLAGLWAWTQSNSAAVAVLALAVPLLVGGLSGALRVAGRLDASQQVANGGIAIGLTAVLLQIMGLVFYGQHWGVEALGELSVVSLLVPGWLLLTGTGVEHLVHPGQQEGVRSRVRGMMLALVVVGVLAAVFAVLKIHMLVFSGMLGFLGFLAVIIGVFWLILRFVF
jgi:hypothetical protein